jgi:hypothetical protein
LKRGEQPFERFEFTFVHGGGQGLLHAMVSRDDTRVV